MRIWERLTRLWRQDEKESEDPYSIVLLLRQPHFFTIEEIQAAGERGWGKVFDGKADPMFFVTQQSWVTMIKAGSCLVNVLHAKQPYLDDREEVAKQLPRADQKKAWLAHTSWTSFDLLNSSEISKAKG